MTAPGHFQPVTILAAQRLVPAKTSRSGGKRSAPLGSAKLRYPVKRPVDRDIVSGTQTSATAFGGIAERTREPLYGRRI